MSRASSCLLCTLALLLLAAAMQRDDLRFWLENMMHHDYSLEETAQVLGMPKARVEAALKEYELAARRLPARPPDAPLLVLPYPGGRHPRIGFLEGAIDPMRGTKASVFLPWPDAGYVVVDLPEAVWSQLGLTFLAHTHIPTIWDSKGVKIQNIDWTRLPDGGLEEVRVLPNGIEIGSRVVPEREQVRMMLWLRNGTSETLSQLRAQVCVMLKGAAAFNAQTNDNKILKGNTAAVGSSDGRRWIITAWERGRTWANPPVPCLHSDPRFPDCAPGKTVRAQGWVRFYEGEDVQSEIERLQEVR